MSSVKSVATAGETIAGGFFASGPSGKIMTIGGIGFLLSFGGAYFGLETFLIALGMGISGVMSFVGYLGARQSQKEERRMEAAKAELEGRERRSQERSDDTRIPSAKTKEFCNLIDRPMTQVEIAALKFEPDDKLPAKDARARVKLARGVDSGVPLGLVVKLPNDTYIARSHYPPSDETILEAR